MMGFKRRTAIWLVALLLLVSLGIAGAYMSYRVVGFHNVYARYNQFNGDPVTGLNIRAFNFGYFHPIGKVSRLSLDYQFKNHPSFEDDAVNGRFQITWGILVK